MIVFDKGLDAFFHSLIPSGLQRTLRPNTMAYIRVRALSTMLVMITTLSLLTNLLVGGGHLLFQPEMLKYDLVALLLLVLLLLQTWLFYRFQNDWISGIAFTNFYFLMAVVLVLLSGGYSSHGKAFLLTCPIISFLVGGRQEGLQNTLFLVLVCWGMAGLHIMGFSAPNLFAGQPPFLMFSVNWLATVLVITIILIVYETELQRRIQSQKTLIPDKESVEVLRRVYTWMDRIVPSAFRVSIDSRSVMYARIQGIAVMLWLGVLVSSLIVIFFVAYHVYVSPEFLMQDMIIVGIALFFALQLVLLYRVHHYRLSSILMSVSYSVMIFSLVLLSGGYRSAFMVLLLTCPIVSFMVNGMRGGSFNAFFMAGIGIVLGYLEFSGQGLVNQIGNVSDVIYFSIIWPIIISGIAVCMILYDMELEKP